MTEPVLSVDGLAVEYRSQDRRTAPVRVIDDMHLDIQSGETVGLVGESGSGKSTLAYAITGLVPAAEGSIRFEGTELVGLKGRARRTVQQRIQLVFQNALLSLSPRRTVGWQLDEPLRVHTTLDAAARTETVERTLEALELTPAMCSRLPHELSGGQAQRVVLARALVLEPTLILFDEPTSALDVSVQASVLNLLQRLKDERGLTYLFITHDLGVARHLCDRVAVMRRGEIVELRPTAELFASPAHDYTRSLLRSSPTVQTESESS